MKKLLFVFALAFVAFTQVTMAQSPVLNIYVKGPDNSTQYDIYFQIVDNNNNVISGNDPILLVSGHCFGVVNPLYLEDYLYSSLTLTPPNPSPINYCKIQVGIVVTGTQSPIMASGQSVYMSFNELITSAEPVKITF